MPWCPKCKCEYRDGITECADCKVPLVDELPTENELQSENERCEADYNSQPVMPDEDSEQGGERKSHRGSAGVYQDKRTKAEDFKSSAYTLLLVGILGIAALILIELGILPIHLAAPGKYITYIVMSVMFIIFIIMGITSLRSSKQYEGEAKAEDEQTAAIKAWTFANLNREIIADKASRKSQDVSIEDLPQEVQYFHYYSVLRTEITEQFGELDAVYLDALCEELYGALFDES